jgi:hypothetical protein
MSGEPLAPALAGLALMQGAEASTSRLPFPRGDGFVYPGQPGSEGIESFERAYESWNRALPAPAADSPLEREFGWLAGRWSVEARDFEADGSGIVRVGAGRAEASIVGDGRWVRLEARAGRFMWIYHVGYDRLRRRYVLHGMLAPGVGPTEPAFSPGWQSERIRFGPYAVDARGLRLRDRLTLVRQSRDGFRLVTEAVLPNGRIVAVDDLIFTRAPD